MSACRRLAARAAILGAATAVTVLAGSQVAWAHVEVTATPAQAGAANATVSFTAEAESQSAGIAGMNVQLPEGIAPADVTLAAGPPGWTLTATADGYQVTGPPLAVGTTLEYGIKIAQLPNATSLSFKSVQRYTDGKEDAWIQVPVAGQAEPDRPAPTVELAPAAAQPTPSASSAAPTDVPTEATSLPPVNDNNAVEDDDSSNAPLIITIVVIVVVLGAGGGYFLWRRRSGSAGDAS